MTPDFSKNKIQVQIFADGVRLSVYEGPEAGRSIAIPEASLAWVIKTLQDTPLWKEGGWAESGWPPDNANVSSNPPKSTKTECQP
jgi:hypothetical protein